ncbi:hypothetical protein ACK8P5_04940 [Paenibacillus sp. EC2-1]|uniref:mediterrocin family bacteriocin n=1 Tax=Paenibacillus sp. EC2-1 TaxID=3388665 RepID=UPI003BEF395A
MKKKLLSSILTLSLLSLTLSAFASAYDSGGHGFGSSWTAYDDGGTGFNTWEVKYGFNKYAIDEDFIHGYHNSKGHTVKLTNGNGTYSDSDTAGNWSRVDVRHSGNAVYYNFNF